MGLEELRSVFGDQVVGFVPPFNTYGATTVQAARAAGLTYLSGGYESVVDSAALAIVPRTNTIQGLREAIADARRIPFASFCIVMAMHHYEFGESGSDRSVLDLSQLAGLLSWVAEQADVSVTTLADLAPRLTPAQWLSATKRLRRRNALPPLVRRLLPASLITPRLKDTEASLLARTSGGVPA